MFGIAISSLTYNTRGSKKRPAPEAIPLFLAYDFANPLNKKNIKNAIPKIPTTLLVIDKSSGVTLVGCPCSPSVKVPLASVLYIFSWCNT